MCACFLEGRSEAVEDHIKEQMEEAAENFEFELAAKLRDQLTSVAKITGKQNIITGSGDQDALGMARSDLGICMQVFFIRSGKMVGRDHFLLKGTEEESDEAALTAFLKQYYNQVTFIPREILLPMEIEEQELVADWLSGVKQAKVAVDTQNEARKKMLCKWQITMRHLC